MSRTLLRVLVLILAMAFAASPLLSPNFAGYRPEQFPVQVSNWPAQPAGWAFSIWLLIYAALIFAPAYALVRAPQDEDWNRSASPLAISLAIGVFWVPVAGSSPLLATVMIIPMLAFAIAALSRSGPPLWQNIPLGLYAGWLTAANGAAISVILAGYGITGAQTGAVLMLCVVLVVGLLVSAALPRTWPYRAGIIWALAGVIAANVTPLNLTVVLLCVVGIVLLALNPGRRLKETGRAMG